jgi:hypothetical protein
MQTSLISVILVSFFFCFSYLHRRD